MDRAMLRPAGERQHGAPRPGAAEVSHRSENRKRIQSGCDGRRRSRDSERNRCGQCNARQLEVLFHK
ncbi:hypothetical protein [Burkholderia pseudomallei]|uniref:hypothetical protein n=1 Tax=Burkholderia pseudomallei TaxID=28450 RepID=UPI000AD23231|nr:hypothetical protein [Burkholderia pseudomallei]